MNILIPDSWLKELLKTKASARQIADILSLKSVSVERLNKSGDDYIYDIEVTTNRPDLMSVEGIAKEANAVLNSEGVESKFIPLEDKEISIRNKDFPLDIKVDAKLVKRVCAVIMEVKIDSSPKYISERLEKSGIRSINNVIDVTNYIMREVGHPTHVFDLDRLNTKSITITKSQAGEEITTLDNKNYELLGDDIIAKDENGRIVDLLGIMGTANSVVNENTKKILFFIDNNNPVNIRNTSMNLGIRTEAAILNEKQLDANLAMKALLRGVELYKEVAEANVISSIFDFYPHPKDKTEVKVSVSKISEVIGIDISPVQAINYLKSLGFKTVEEKGSLKVLVPTIRTDVGIEEDIIEEIARIYGYHKLPSKIPAFFSDKPLNFYNNFYFEQKTKNAMKYLGFDEVYTYSLISEEKFEGPLADAVKIKNPLSVEMTYLRNSLIPNLLEVMNENKKRELLKIFEISNIYIKKAKDLPEEVLMFSGLYKKPNADFYEVKKILENVLKDLGINHLTFKESRKSAVGASLYIKEEYLGEVEVLDTNLIDFELNYQVILKFTNASKVYKPVAKFAAIEEDISIISQNPTQEIVSEIFTVSENIKDVQLRDTYKDSRTFHITYQSKEKNLTKEEAAKIREKIISTLTTKVSATIRG